MHLYLSYSGTVIEILFPRVGTLKLLSEQIVDLEQNLGRRIDVTVAYTELEANDTKYRYKNVEDAIAHLERLVAQYDDQKRSEIDKLAIELDQLNIKYRRTDAVLEFNEQFANLDYFFSIEINDDGESVEVYYDCESLGNIGSRNYDSVDEVIEDLLKLKELDSKFKSLVANTPFNLDRSKEEE